MLSLRTREQKIILQGGLVDMVRKTFDRELELLNRSLIEMGNLCVDGIDLALDALFKKDAVESINEKVHIIERDTDRKERDIEDLCMKLILRQQPVARDLKVISAALRMVSDMERIGDQVADIADIAKNIGDKTLGGETHIKDMAMEAKTMVINSVESFVNKNIELADNVIESDEKVDVLFVQLKRELLKIIYKDISLGQIALDVLMVAKYFERLGDHAVNIAECVKYAYK